MAFLQAILIRAAFWSVRLLPVRLAGAIGAGLGRAAFYLDRRHRAVALRNLARIYPQRERRWRRLMARESFAELGRTVFELPHVFLRSREFLLSRVEIVGEQGLRTAIDQGRGVHITACHHSNWELGALMFSMLGYDVEFIYRPLRQQAAEKYLKTCRERFGATLHSRWEPMRWLARAFRRNACVPIMIDQHQSNGMPVPFLGHLAATTTLPAAFALRHNVPVFGAVLERMGKDFRFCWRIWPIDLPAPGRDKSENAYRLMQSINRSFEDIIHQRPELWLWVHRRWRILEQSPELREVVHGTP